MRRLFSAPSFADRARARRDAGAVSAAEAPDDATPAALPDRAPRRPRAPRPAPAAAPRSLVAAPPEGGLRLSALQALGKGGRWRTDALRAYPFDALYWITRGQGRVTLAGLTRGYGAHNAVFVPALCMHGLEVTAQVFGTAVFFGAEHGLPLPPDACHLRIRDAAAQAEITGLIEQIAREDEGDRPFRDRAIEHHAGLLAVWLARQAAAAEPGRDTAARRLMRAYTQAIETALTSPGRPQSVADHADRLGVTPTHLTRASRACCGRAASDILADRLTYEARRLLVETDLPVKAIAGRLGYGSAAYFTRVFQNRTGQTPTGFRKAR